MTWPSLLWLLPVMAAIAIVLGAAGRTGFTEVRRAIVSTFIALTLGVVVVGVVIHLVATVFA